jgi:AAA15 family ATPase/GTPase
MDIKSMTIENFRSISKAKKINFGKHTVLIGPNNAGKSNFIGALHVFMETIDSLKRLPGRPISIIKYPAELFAKSFDWDRDFPVEKQKKYPEGICSITVEFDLRDDEISLFREQIGSKLSGYLPIQIALGRAELSFSVVKQGPGAAALAKKAGPIAKFLSERVHFASIPAVRTAQSAQRVIEAMVERELGALRKHSEYRNALEKLAEIERETLARISDRTKDTLSRFIPRIKDVLISIPDDRRREYTSRACKIEIDDGRRTLLVRKGDGLQSLAALSLMRHSADDRAASKSLIVAIEEPEAHLHPAAIHELRSVLYELTENHQVIITTHNPLLVDRERIENNVIIENSSAKPARNIEELRVCLGVRAGDNLRHANFILMVEGESDRRIVEAIVGHRSKRFRHLLNNGSMIIEKMHGVDQLSQKVESFKKLLCGVHIFIDCDQRSKAAKDNAIEAKIIDVGEYHLTSCLGMPEAELEDLINPDIYNKIFMENLGITEEGISKFSKQHKKWTERLKEAAVVSGKDASQDFEKNAKSLVADAVCRQPDAALWQHRRAAFDSFAEALEVRLSGMAGSSA